MVSEFFATRQRCTNILSMSFEASIYRVGLLKYNLNKFNLPCIWLKYLVRVLRLCQLVVLAGWLTSRNLNAVRQLEAEIWQSQIWKGYILKDPPCNTYLVFLIRTPRTQPRWKPVAGISKRQNWCHGQLETTVNQQQLHRKLSKRSSV